MLKKPRQVINQLLSIGKEELRIIKAPESVYFLTFHKCASSLFSGYVLKQVEGLRNLDYSAKIYRNQEVKNVVFRKKGYIYGPIRLSADPRNEVYRRLVAPMMKSSFLHDKKSILLVRDPRDILVSAYYSFGFTHPLSKNSEIREHLLADRENIRQLSLDEYVLQAAPRLRDEFNAAFSLHKACPKSRLLRYEELIEDFATFAETFTSFCPVRPEVLEKIYHETRPREKEKSESHRRSGRVGGYQAKLQETTIRKLDCLLHDVLIKFQYAG
jgi:hypothetical protein